MAESALTTAVKNALGVTGTFTDATIQVYINEVVDYMLGAGVSQAVIDAPSSFGVVARGVSDLWDNDGGNVKFSPYFHERVTQLVISSSRESSQPRDRICVSYVSYIGRQVLYH